MSAGPLLAMDVGNSTVKAAVRSEIGWDVVLRVPTRPVEGLAERLAAAWVADAADRCVVSSVCPQADGAVTAVLPDAEFFGRQLPVPMPAKVAEPDAVGVDRLLLALGALEAVGAPCVVVSAGTAVTVDLVDADGAFAGGAIAPGLGLSARALHTETALLPAVEPAVPDEVPGQDTPQALLGGIYWSCAGGVLELARRYCALPGCEAATVVCTGSDAPLLLPALGKLDPQHEPHLIFDGMWAAL